MLDIKKIIHYICNQRQLLLVFLVILFFVYLPRLLYTLYIPDDYLLADGSELAQFMLSGNARWVHFLLHHYILDGGYLVYPYVNGLITLFAIAVSGLLTCRVLKIDDKPFWLVLMGATLVIVSPYMAGNILFTTNMPTIGISILMAVSAVFVLFETRHISRYFLAFIFTVIAFGGYQTTIQLMIALIIMRWVIDLSFNAQDQSLSKISQAVLELIVMMLLLAVAGGTSLFINGLLLDIYVPGVDYGRSRVAQAVSAEESSTLNLIWLFEHFLLKTEDLRTKLGVVVYLVPILGVFLLTVVAFVYFSGKISDSIKVYWFKLFYAAAVVLCSFAIVLAHPRGYFEHEGVILISSYLIFLVGMIAVGWHAFNQRKKVDTVMLLIIVGLLGFVAIVPLIIHLPLLFGQSIGIRAHFSVAWLVAGGFALCVHFLSKARKWMLALSAYLIVLSISYGWQIFQLQYRTTLIDIASAVSLVSVIRSHEDYSSVKEPVRLRLVGGRLPLNIGEMTPGNILISSMSFPHSKYGLLERQTDFKFEKVTEELWETLITENFVGATSSVVYPQRDAVKFIAQHNTVVVYLAEEEGSYAPYD